jgi:Flp pilus assembly protein TadD
MGEACLKVGDKKMAMANYRKALELDPGNDKIKRILRELAADK